MTSERIAPHNAGNHPVLISDYVIPTEATHLVSLFAIKIVRSRQTGCLIMGDQRSGKSHAIRQIIAALREAFGNKIQIFYLDSDFAEQAPTESRYYSSLLEGIEHEYWKEGKANEKRSRFREAIVSAVGSSKQHRVVFIFDEAQTLREEQYGWMINDFNYFVRRGIKPTYLLVGQHELKYQKQAFIYAKKRQIVGRFMIREHVFRGIRNYEDLLYCLESYDQCTEYPEKSEISYTAYFFPSAVRHGWGLVKLAPKIWEAYGNLRRQHQFPSNRDILMQYFAPVVEDIYSEFGDINLIEPRIDVAWIEKSIEESGFISAERTESGDPA